MWQNDLANGREGEQLVALALQNKGHNVMDVSEDREYQLRDIDFVLRKSDQTTTLEVKNDIRSCQTGNVFIETYNRNNRQRNGIGWYYYCEAEFLAFVQQKYAIAHIISRYDLIQLAESGLYRKRQSAEAEGYCIPVSALADCKSYTKIIL